MPSVSCETFDIEEECSSALCSASQRLHKPSFPTVIQDCSTTRTYSFPARVELDPTSPNNTASRRRGRFVIKLAATLYLATQDDYDTPEKCAAAISSLWGHAQLGREYLRRQYQSGNANATYTPQQLTSAEAQWKAALGWQVLEEDGFQRCWQELVPYFKRSLEEMRRGKSQTPTPGPAANTSAKKSAASLIASAVPATRFKAAGVFTYVPSNSTASTSSAPQAAVPFQSSTVSAATSPQRGPMPLLDLAKVRTAGLSALFSNTLRFLRCAAAPRQVVDAAAAAVVVDTKDGMRGGEGEEEEERFCASRGWLPVRYVLDGVYAELSTDSALKTLWTWLLALPVKDATALYLSLLLPLNVSGALQLMHAGEPCQRKSNAAQNLRTTQPSLSSVTHLRAAWGHDDAAVAMAVLQEHPRVPLRSLAALPPPDEAAAPHAPGAALPDWFEYVEDTKVLRKALTDIGGPVYPPEEPFQVLISRDAVSELSRPLMPPSLRDATAGAGAGAAAASTTDALAKLMRRTRAPSHAPGGNGSGAFGSVDAELTSVSVEEFAALLRPGSSFSLAAAVAAMTFAASRLAFAQIGPHFFGLQDASVHGLALHTHLTRTPRSSQRKPQHHQQQQQQQLPNCSGECGNANAELCEESPLLSAVAAPGSPRAVLVLPHTLSFGLLQPTPSSHDVSLKRPLRQQQVQLPSVTAVVDGRAVYDLAPFVGRGGLFITVRRPPTELLVDLRIASLWDIWIWYGFTQPSSAATTTTTNARSDQSKVALTNHTAGAAGKGKGHRNLQLVAEEEMGVMSKLPLPLPLPQTTTASLTPSSVAISAVTDQMHEVNSHAETSYADPNNAAGVMAALKGTVQSTSDVPAGEEKAAYAVPRLPWEYFPGAQAEALVLRLDAACNAALAAAWAKWWPATGVHILTVSPSPARDEKGVSATCAGTRGGDILLSLLSSDDSPINEAAAATALHLPQWKVRENALWDGLSRWVSAVQAACDTPAFSLLLPPSRMLLQTPVPLADNPNGPTIDTTTTATANTETVLEARSVGQVGRKKGIANLRRLIGSSDAATNFFIEEERIYRPKEEFSTHPMWVIEDAENLALRDARTDEDGGYDAVAPDDAYDSGCYRDGRWTVTKHPSVLLADLRDINGERVVAMCLQQACVLHRTDAGNRGRTPAGATGATAPPRNGSANYTAAVCTSTTTSTITPSRHDGGAVEEPGGGARLLRFIERSARSTRAAPPANASTPQNLASSTLSSTPSPEEKSPKMNSGAGGVLEELERHAPLRHSHAGCRASPLACDEWVLGVAWPAAAIVDYVLLPPLREALNVYRAKLQATAQQQEQQQLLRGGGRAHAIPPSPNLRAAVTEQFVTDLRAELLGVLTDEKVMEQREFYGDGLLDYCVAVSALYYRHAATNVAIWRGGNITESSTNSALVVQALPRVLRDYWMSRRRIHNDKRLADCVESLFGALSMALWVLPLRRRHAAWKAVMEDTEGVVTTKSNDLPLLDADMLLYVASALLQLLSGGK